MTGTPPVRRRLLGAVLRRYRENLGYDLADAARVLDCDPSKISRIETGQRGISRRDLRALLDGYGVAEGEARSVLEAIGDPRRAHGWWQEYADVLPEAMQDYLTLEAVAAQVRVYETQQVPALLQTADYARAVAASDPCVPPGLQARSVSARLARQEQVLTPEGPAVSAVIWEGALYQAVGGASLMRAQFAHLAAISGNRARVTIQVLPFTSGAHPGVAAGPAEVLGFAHASGLAVVKLASLSGGVLIDGHRDAGQYVRLITELRGMALPPDKSTRMLQRLAGR